jgi:deoxyribose-phosphate aldolase
MEYTYAQIAGSIDHALLSPTLTTAELEGGCDLALAYEVASVCVLPYYLRRVSERLAGSRVLPSTVIGFPHGGQATAVKRYEAETALADGGRELDMVVNLSQVLSGEWSYVRDEIASIVDVAHAAGGRVKVIFENCYLRDEHKIRLCEICGELRVDWVKTSTGFGTAGATSADVALMRKHSPAHVQVKASGGVRDFERSLKYLRLGATRIGASRTAEILNECRSHLGLAPLEHPPRESHTPASY